jgi:hypothetical protein
MHIEKVKFDNVFDVAASRGDFSFRSGGRTVYGAKLQHHDIPPEGSIYAIAFAEPDDWTTVLGWRDLASQKVTLKRPLWWFWIDKLSDIAIYGMFFIGGGLLFAGVRGALAAALAMLLVLLWQGCSAMRLNRTVKHGLLTTAA